MKKETFEKAIELNSRIEDIDTALRRIESNSKDGNGFPLNFSFTYDDDDKAIKGSVIKHLKNQRAKYQKQFDLLK